VFCTQDEIAQSLHIRVPSQLRLLGRYTAEGVDYALGRYGIIQFLRRLGYTHPKITLDNNEVGDRIRICGLANNEEYLLIECVLEHKNLFGSNMLYVHWLTLRNPRTRFVSKRPQLPGQEVPGLGLARESVELLIRIAKRLYLDGIAFRPSWYHTAYAARYHLRFVNPIHQGQFEAMMRDLSSFPLWEASVAISDGRVFLNNEPYSWEADPMAYWFSDSQYEQDAIKDEYNRVHFALFPQSVTGNRQSSQ